MERILTFVDPRFEVSIPAEVSAEPDTYRGHEGVRRYFETFAEAMAEIRFAAERVWTAGEEDLVVELRLTATGRQTGIPVEQRVFLVWTVREGKALQGGHVRVAGAGAGKRGAARGSRQAGLRGAPA